MAKRDFYQILGVSKDATADQIKSAYRALARKLHPDVNKAADAAKKFAEVQDAYDVLSDPTKRKHYDQRGHAPPEQPGQGSHYSWSNVGRGGGAAVNADELSEMFESFFGGTQGQRTRARKARPARPEPTEHDLPITFLTAAKGGTESIRLESDGQEHAVQVRIPAGVRQAAKLRVGGPDGDLILRVRIGNHPIFRRTESKSDDQEGLDLYFDLPLTLAEATLGATVSVPTLDGTVELQVPPGSASGRKLRLRGKGIGDDSGTRGDLFALVRIVPPPADSLTADERDMLLRLSARAGSPRTSW
ncbi:MAG: DnaJ C-terminal domain-containing protein [Phycisphaerales bacterium]